MTKQQIIKLLESRLDELETEEVDLYQGTLSWHNVNAKLQEVEEIIKRIKELENE